ncbi:MAG: MBL fold metallo-hydrolase, partial [Lachnospiraceae bacterium]|nr:MBL fold metallo-hydrolase [Lachnospiraceae bacterium]
YPYKRVIMVYKYIRELKINPAIWLLVCFIIFLPFNKMSCKMVTLDIGQGECTYIRTGDGKHILSDCGSSDEKKIAEYKVMPCLKYYGTRNLDYVFVSHCDNDHISGIKEIVEDNLDINIGKIILPYLKEEQKSDSYREFEKLFDKSKIIYFCNGDMVKGRGYRITCFHPDDNGIYADENGYSMCLLYSTGKHNVLFTGDIDTLHEESLAKNLSDKGIKYVDILKVPHHGSKTSTSELLLDTIKPDYGIISAGLNNSYGHPNNEVLERLDKYNVKVYKTLGKGAIVTDGLKSQEVRINIFNE